jgi:uncharacterized protein (DUF924 family)
MFKESPKMKLAEPENILEFWFGANDGDGEVIKAKSWLWWSKNEVIDRSIANRFGDDLDRAIGGAIDHWALTPRGQLALIILMDQFSRNIYRGTPRAFAQDKQACTLCLTGLEKGQDQVLRPVERAFFYLPLEHSESLPSQEKSVELYRVLYQWASPDLKTNFQEFLDFAIRHRDIIQRFGRFPHRNVILGRESTPEELEFLQQSGSSF